MSPIAIGIGCRRACPGSEIQDLVMRACTGLSLEGARLFSLDVKREERGLWDVAATLGLPLVFFTAEQMKPVLPFVGLHSPRAEAAVGISSVAEAAALTGAGPDARLLVPRIAAGGATCAVAAAGRDGVA